MRPEGTELKGWLHNHPKTFGVLFSLTVLLSQVGSAAAHVQSIYGP
jgi:hypothetical protein